MSYSEAAATEGWCCPDETGLLLQTVELIPHAHVSLRVSGARKYRSGGRGQSQGSWKPRVSSGNKMLPDGGPHWLSRPAERLLMVRAPACSTAKPSRMVHIAWPPGTGIICSKLLSFLPAVATGVWEETLEGQCPGVLKPAWVPVSLRDARTRCPSCGY